MRNIKNLLSILVMLIFICSFGQNKNAAGEIVNVGMSLPSNQAVASCVVNGITINATGTTTTPNYSTPSATVLCAPPANFGGSGVWTEAFSGGTVVYTFSQPLFSATVSYSSVNGPNGTGHDFGLVSVNGGGTMSLTNACGATISGNTLACNLAGTNNPYGDVSVKVSSTIAFTTITLTNVYNTSGWVQGNMCNFLLEPFNITGNITLNAVNENCPLFPLNVTGSYNIPSGATISNIRLQVVNSSNSIVSTIYSPTLTGPNLFSFPVNLSDFGTASPMTGNFEFRVLATVSQSGATITISKFGANPGPDISFSNCSVCCAACCVDNQSLYEPVTATQIDTRQANLRIQAINTINNGATASYHAGYYVLLKNGFAALSGSKVRIYNVGCTGDYFSKQSQDNDDEQQEDKLEVTQANQVSISPNPTTGILKIASENLNDGTIQITDLFGTTVFKSYFKNQKEIEINIQNQSKGVYIVKIITANQTYTHKIIKN